MAAAGADPGPFLQDLVEFYKALADRTRLRIAGLLAERPRSMQELALALEANPKTISRHLSRLRQARLVAAQVLDGATTFRLETDQIDRLSRTLLNREVPPGDERAHVLRPFFDGERIRRLPATQSKKLMILEEVARRVAPGRRYTEREVDAILKAVYDDHCELRRALVDYRFLSRDRGIYTRAV